MHHLSRYAETSQTWLEEKGEKSETGEIELQGVGCPVNSTMHSATVTPFQSDRLRVIEYTTSQPLRKRRSGK